MDLIKSHPEEKVEMILEPLQVLTKLAVLSYLPVGTKISISNNIFEKKSIQMEQTSRKVRTSDKYFLT